MSNLDKTLEIKLSNVYFLPFGKLYIMCISYCLRNLSEEYFFFLPFLWLTIPDGICFTCGCCCVVLPSKRTDWAWGLPCWQRATSRTALLAKCLEDSKDLVHCWEEQGAYRDQGLARGMKKGC